MPAIERDLPFRDLFAEDGFSPNPYTNPRQILAAAEVIFGVDDVTEEQFLVFGIEAIKGLFSDKHAVAFQVLYITLDLAGDDLAKLLAVVQAIKGRDDYRLDQYKSPVPPRPVHCHPAWAVA
jgi:hypothetical protein